MVWDFYRFVGVEIRVELVFSFRIRVVSFFVFDDWFYRVLEKFFYG